MNDKTQVIDLRLIIKKILEHKLGFILTFTISVVLSSIYITSFPRYYSTDTQLAPEINNSTESGGLSSIASSFGLDMGKINTLDAITPLLYPELMKDNKFLSSFFNIKVKTQDGKLETNYYEYLSKYQTKSYLFSSFSKSKDSLSLNIPNQNINPYVLNKEQDKIIKSIAENIKLTVDSKTGVITIKATAQDPLVCKTLADSVRSILQSFITAYRTNKARADVAYYTKLSQDAKAAYEKARQVYGSYSDANSEVILESYRSKQEDLENDMQLKFNTYSQLSQQLQTARTKLREKTPAFTILKGASVPTVPEGPKRMVFVLSITILSLVIFVISLLRKDIAKLFI